MNTRPKITLANEQDGITEAPVYVANLSYWKRVLSHNPELLQKLLDEERQHQRKVYKARHGHKGRNR